MPTKSFYIFILSLLIILGHYNINYFSRELINGDSEVFFTNDNNYVRSLFYSFIQKNKLYDFYYYGEKECEEAVYFPDTNQTKKDVFNLIDETFKECKYFIILDYKNEDGNEIIYNSQFENVYYNKFKSNKMYYTGNGLLYLQEFLKES